MGAALIPTIVYSTEGLLGILQVEMAAYGVLGERKTNTRHAPRLKSYDALQISSIQKAHRDICDGIRRHGPRSSGAFFRPGKATFPTKLIVGRKIVNNG